MVCIVLCFFFFSYFCSCFTFNVMKDTQCHKGLNPRASRASLAGLEKKKNTTQTLPNVAEVAERLPRCCWVAQIECTSCVSAVVLSRRTHTRTCSRFSGQISYFALALEEIFTCFVLQKATPPHPPRRHNAEYNAKSVFLSISANHLLSASNKTESWWVDFDKKKNHHIPSYRHRK